MAVQPFSSQIFNLCYVCRVSTISVNITTVIFQLQTTYIYMQPDDMGHTLSETKCTLVFISSFFRIDSIAILYTYIHTLNDGTRY